MLRAKVLELLDSEHVPYEVVGHRVAFTAHGTAAATHVPGRSFAKVLVAQAEAGHPLMAVLPANCHLDLQALAEVAGQGPLQLVPETELQRLFPDCEVGAMPPLGAIYGLPVFFSSCLGSCPEVSFNAGNHHEAVRMKYADLERVARPKVGAFCR